LGENRPPIEDRPPPPVYYPPPPPVYGGYYGGWDYYDDDFAEAIIVGTVVAGTAAAISESDDDDDATSDTGSSLPSQLPCQPVVHDVKGVKYYQCGTQYFVEVYGGSGPLFMPVAPPPQ
jgi:hypothetical protein